MIINQNNFYQVFSFLSRYHRSSDCLFLRFLYFCAYEEPIDPVLLFMEAQKGFRRKEKREKINQIIIYLSISTSLSIFYPHIFIYQLLLFEFIEKV